MKREVKFGEGLIVKAREIIAFYEMSVSIGCIKNLLLVKQLVDTEDSRCGR